LEALGHSRGGLTTKIHCVVDANGLPIDLKLTGGEVHDVQEAAGLLAGKSAKYVIGDKGYDAGKVDKAIESIGAIAVIPVRKCCHYRRQYPAELYKQRNLIERFFNRLKRFRRIGTRYEKKGVNFLAMVLVGAILTWLS
jgi:putative transposase